MKHRLLCCLLVLLALLALPACGGDDTATGAEEQVAGRLPALLAFVEQERGLSWRREVDVQVLDDEDFLDAFRAGEEEPEDGYPVEGTWGALGLDELDEQLDEELDETLLGFYDGSTEELVVRARPLDAYLELVLVHELTHALQDQWFKVDRPELWDSTERAIAFDAVVEGDALRVERAFYEQLPADVRAEVDEEAGRAPGEAAYEPVVGADPVAIELDFVYGAGLRLVDALLERGGQELLDATFRHPPTTTAQVLHPELIGAEPPVVPPAPRGDGELVDEGTLGERGLALVLAVDPLAADGPQVGWAGDSYATYDDGEQVCTLAAVRMSSPPARDRLVAALEAAGLVASATGPAGLELESCA